MVSDLQIPRVDMGPQKMYHEIALWPCPLLGLLIGFQVEGLEFWNYYEFLDTLKKG